MLRRTTGLLGLLAGTTLLLQAAPALADPPAHAPAWGYRAHEDERRYDDHDRDDHRYDYYNRYDDRYDGRCDRGARYDRYGHYIQDRDCDHDRRYDARHVYTVDRLPRGYRTVNYRGDRYFYYGDRWYRPYGQRYVQVARPAGLVFDQRGVRLTAGMPIVR